MRQYFCAINDDKSGLAGQVISDSLEEIAAFVAKHDVPGRSVYWCPNPLRDDAKARNLETVREVVEIVSDIDFRQLDVPEQEIVATLRDLLITPTEIRNSGGGRHITYRLREPVSADDTEMYNRVGALQKRLAACLSADPAPAHPAALFRVVGTHNTKYEKPIRVEVVGGNGKPVDITELEEMCDLMGEGGLFKRREKTNAPYTGPVDIGKRLDNMAYQGGGGSGVHDTQLSATSAMLRRGMSVAEAVDETLEATRKVGNAEWDYAAEKLTLEQQCYDFINKNPELSYALPDGLREKFEACVADGLRAKIVWARGRGFHCRGLHRRDANLGDNVVTLPVRKRIVAMPFAKFDPAKLPPREWVYGKHYQSGIITATVGPGGGGKSSLNLVELLAICTGRNLLGEQPEQRYRVWYHNAEDPFREIQRRLAAAIQHFGIDQNELVGWLHVTSGLDMPIVIAQQGRLGGLSIIDHVVGDIVETISSQDIQVASFDPLIAHHTGTENATGDMDQICRAFAKIANVTDCAIEIVHHTRKAAYGQEEFTVADSRGAGAIINAVRSARVLNPMPASEGAKRNLDEAERKLYFRIDNGKANMAPPTAAKWYRFASVELPSGESVGVATAWDRPDEEDTGNNNMVEILYLQLLDRLNTAGRHVNHSGGPNFAPKVFASESEAKAAKVGKPAFADAQRRLFADGRIRVEQAGTGGHRVSRVVRS